MHGYVYVIKSPSTGLYKIGRTRSPKARFNTFKTSNPDVLECIHLHKCDDMEYLEGMLHNAFSRKRVRGEWFSLSEDDLIQINAIVNLPALHNGFLEYLDESWPNADVPREWFFNDFKTKCYLIALGFSDCKDKDLIAELQEILPKSPDWEEYEYLTWLLGAA